MSTEKFQNKYRIQSARATWHDYGGGTYFITVRTKNGEHYFGEITNGYFDTQRGDVACRDAACRDAACHVSTNDNIPTMQLSPIGQFLTEKIQNITNHCPYIEIPLFVVMPNHWHAIVFVDGNKTPYVRGGTIHTIDKPHIVEERHVETQHATSLHATGKNKQMQNIANKQGWLSVAIGGIKSAVTKFANENGMDFAWQTRFHDRIIRNQIGMNRIVHYIENNPATWDNDCSNEKNNKNDDKM